MSLKICSLNVRGLTEGKKRRDVFSYLRKKKYDIYFLQECHSIKEKENAWEVEWGYKAFFSSYKSNSRGVGILFNNSFEYEIHEKEVDLEGRYVIIDLTIHNNRLLLVNLYGPNEDDPTFFDIIRQKIEHYTKSEVLMGGDFNVVQTFNEDTLNLAGINNVRANATIHKMKEDLDLHDPWRVQHPQARIFTWHCKNKQSRLDYFLLPSSLIDSVKLTSIKPGYRTDHSLVELTVEFCTQKKGPGIWKFNNSLLRDQTFVEEIKNCIKETILEYSSPNLENTASEDLEFVIDDQLLFETIKLKIRGKTIAYSAEKKRNTDKEEKLLEKEIEEIYRKYIGNPTSDQLISLNHAQEKLKTLREKKIEGVMIRAKAKWHCEGERNSKYFLNLEKQHFLEKKIPKLIDEQGKELVDIKDIVEEQKRFYQHLYSSKVNKNENEKLQKLFFPSENGNEAQLNQNDTITLESNVTNRECLSTLKKMKNGSSPGSDGLTVEFYKFFWKDISPFLLRSLNTAFETGKLSNYQRLGIITCLPKPGKPKEFVENWRPISLLNVDYKILSGTLANRIKNPLQYLISDNQKGFMKNRNISECTRLIYDIIKEMDNRNMEGVLLLIDYQKAFDSIEWSFIDRTLEYFNFGEKFRKWIQILYKDVESSIINNGHMSQRFQLGRGVRQGDPLSPYLFLLVVEILTRAIKRDPNICGITIDGTEFLNSLYADDTTLLLDNDEKSFDSCMKLLGEFAKCSGLKINLTKTVAIKIGKDKTYFTRGEGQYIKWQFRGKFNLLGIEFNLDEEDFTKNNYIKKLAAFQKVLNTWSARDLTIFGRITIIKSVALPQLVHLFSSIPNPPADILQKLQNACFSFIWNKVEKIKRTVMYNEYENGGFKVPHIKTFCQSLKVVWVKRMLDNLNFSDWKVLLCSNIENYGGNGIWLAKEKNPIFLKVLNPFWKDVYEAWETLNKSDGSENPLAEPLFYNDHIKIGGRTVFFKNWYLRGTIFVNDLVDEQGEFLPWEEIKEKTGTNFLQHRSIIEAIPRNWKTRIKETGAKLRNIEQPITEELNRAQKPSRFVYKLIIENIRTLPQNSQHKWNLRLNEEISVERWSDLYSLLYESTKETKLRAFQQKILHNILPTNTFLYKCNLVASPNCTFCLIQRETIDHLLWECKKSKTIWLQLAAWLKNNNVFYEFNEINTLLGDCSAQNMIEHIKLITKEYIYAAKIKEEDLSLQRLLQRIKMKYQIESYYTKNQEKMNEKWKKIQNALENV